jgi:hypothetical protein
MVGVFCTLDIYPHRPLLGFGTSALARGENINVIAERNL